MSNQLLDSLLSQLDNVIDMYRGLRSKSKYDDLSDLKGPETNKLLTMARATIERIGGKNSVYTRQAETALDKYGTDSFRNIVILGGIVEALKEDLLAGNLRTIQELIHAELFADFLEMADHLLAEGYKDAAAVIAGSSLEAHLRQLCQKNGIDVDFTTAKGDVVPKKASRLNADLAKDDVYSKLDQKSVTAWLDLRNKAAHGKYNEYLTAQVALMIAGIREFMTRTPA